MTTPPPNSVEIEAKRLLRDLSHCPETAKEPLIWNALNSQRRSALEGVDDVFEDLIGIAESHAMQTLDRHGATRRVIEKAKALRSLLEVKG